MQTLESPDNIFYKCLQVTIEPFFQRWITILVVTLGIFRIHIPHPLLCCCTERPSCCFVNLKIDYIDEILTCHEMHEFRDCKTFSFPFTLIKAYLQEVFTETFPWPEGSFSFFFSSKQCRCRIFLYSSNEHHYSWTDAVPNELIEFLKSHSYLKQVNWTLNLHQKSAWDSHHSN